jgi:hypothetical protein
MDLSLIRILKSLFLKSVLCSALSKISKHCCILTSTIQYFASCFMSTWSSFHPGILSFCTTLAYDWQRLSLSLASIQKIEQFLLFFLVLCTTSSASYNLLSPPGPTITSVAVVCSLLKSFASSLASCDSRLMKRGFCENEMIDGTLSAVSTFACSLLCAL